MTSEVSASGAKEDFAARYERRQKFNDNLRAYAPYIAFVLLVIGFSIASPVFMSTANFLNIGRQTTLVTIIAVGMTLIIIAGEIDLSVGASLALSGVAAAMAMAATDGNLIVGILFGLGTGAFIGFVNGFLTTWLRIPSFLVTLGMLGIARGTALLITDTKAIPVENPVFWTTFGEGSVIGLPVPVFFTIVTLLIGIYVLHFMSFGRKVYAVGGNARAARYSGLNVAWVKISTFVITGVFVGLAGLILTGRSHAARPDIAAGLELDVLAAVIMGGTSLFGGRGTIIGTLLGSLLIGVINNGLTLMSVSSSAQLVIKGIIIIAAVAFSSDRKS